MDSLENEYQEYVRNRAVIECGNVVWVLPFTDQQYVIYKYRHDEHYKTWAIGHVRRFLRSRFRDEA